MIFIPFLLLACRTTPTVEVVESIGPTLTPLPPSPTATITPEPTETPRPSPTPIRARINVQNQAINEAGILLIEEVVLSDPGWIVIFNSLDGVANEVIGATAVSFGVIADLEIEIDLARASETLVVQLFQANDESVEFELQTNDPLSPPVFQEIQIELNITLPEIEISELDVSQDGVLTVDSVLSSQNGWVVIHTFDDEVVGELVGIVHVDSGLTRDVQVPLRWREASAFLLVTLLADNGRIDTYEPELDTPIRVAQQDVQFSIEVTLPIDVVVYDQPLVDGFVTIERVVSPEDGWLAIYHEENDGLGLIIGYAPIKAGVNEQVLVDVIDSAVTDPMYIVLHEDTNPGDDFDLPIYDQPFVIDNQALEPFSFSTTPAIYFIAYNQPLQQREELFGIEIASIFVAFQSWVVVQSIDESGALGTVLGQTAVSAGNNRDVFVPISEALAGQTVMVTLYLNSGDPELFELEEEIDIPLRIELQEIQAPLVILPNEAEP